MASSFFVVHNFSKELNVSHSLVAIDMIINSNFYFQYLQEYGNFRFPSYVFTILLQQLFFALSHFGTSLNSVFFFPLHCPKNKTLSKTIKEFIWFGTYVGMKTGLHMFSNLRFSLKICVQNIITLKPSDIHLSIGPPGRAALPQSSLHSQVHHESLFCLRHRQG